MENLSFLFELKISEDLNPAVDDWTKSSTEFGPADTFTFMKQHPAYKKTRQVVETYVIPCPCIIPYKFKVQLLIEKKWIHK